MKTSISNSGCRNGKRYGGLKQMDPMDPMGHAIIDYSIYDAKRAGFGKVVFVIKKAIEKDFKETVGARFLKEWKYVMHIRK